MPDLRGETWVRLLVRRAIGVAVHLGCGPRRSRLPRPDPDRGHDLTPLPGETTREGLQAGARPADLRCMAISVLDVRSSVLPARIALPSRVRTAAPATPRRLPPTVVAAAAIGIGEALGLLAVGLTCLDRLLLSSTRPSGAVVAAVLVLLAGWVVTSAAGGATMVDGAGRRSFVALAHAELFAVGIAGVGAVVVPLPVPTPAGLSLPAVVLLALAVPVAKLLLAGSASAQAWIAAGPRVRERRPDPVARHRVAATLTMAAIGLALGAVALGGPQSDGPGPIGATATSLTADR